MRPKSLLLLALALGCGLVASIGISQVMDRNSKPQMTIETTPIYVALHNINLGDPIDASMLALQEWPKDKVPRGAITELEELEGRRPRTAIIEGEPILEAKLLAPGQVADPIRAIPKDMRLKTIAVDAEKSAAGLLGPGDRVDVQLFVRKDARTGVETATSKVIMQNIRIFAVDQAVQRSHDGGEERTVAKTVSLMLTPEQASKLALAERIGEISLIPRNPDDDSIADTPEFTITDLMNDSEKSSREKEQGREKPAKRNDGGLLAAVQAATPTKPPFVMEIVEAQAIREVSFDPETGRAIRDARDVAVGPGLGAISPALPTAAPGVPGGVPGGVPDNLLDDFPIDFDM